MQNSHLHSFLVDRLALKDLAVGHILVFFKVGILSGVLRIVQI